MNVALWRKPRNYLMGWKVASAMAALSLMTVVSGWAVSLPAAADVVPTVVTIEWHDGNADQINVLPILDDPARPMHATLLVNTGPILANDPAKLTVAAGSGHLQRRQRDRGTHARPCQRPAAAGG